MSSPGQPSTLVPPGPTQSGYLTLPFDHEQFKDFVKGLLGRPQSISRTFVETFEIERQDVQHLHELLQQRIGQQNGGILAQFNARIAYSDHSTVELTSMAELLSYNEVRPLVSTALHLKWDYLVRFHDKQTPERQSIQVSFVAVPGPELSLDSGTVIMVGGQHHFGSGLINVRVEHTARSWGADLEALLSSFVASVQRPSSGMREWARRHCSRLSLAIAIGFFLIVSGGLLLTTRRLADARLAEMQTSVANAGASSDALLRFVASMVAGGVWTQYAFAAVVFLVLAVFSAVWLGIWSDAAAGTRRPSFVLLTREAENEKVKALKRLQRSGYSLLASIASSLALGVLSNVLFARFFE